MRLMSHPFLIGKYLYRAGSGTARNRNAMSTHLTRRKQFELTLAVSDLCLIKPPAHIQRNWVISRALDELADDLAHLDHITKGFITGTARKEITADWATS